jgi:hypothetical protein
MTWWKLGRRHKEERLAALDEYRQLRRIATEDVTVLGEQIADLHVETLGDQLDDEARSHYQWALDGYERAKAALAAAETVEAVVALDELLDRARYERVCVIALRDGEDLPARRGPCFFNPQHGPSRSSTAWTPPGGVERQIEVCNSCSQRLAGGLSVDMRMIRVGDRYVPSWEAGGARLRDIRAASHVHGGHAPHTAAHIAEAELRAGLDNLPGPYGF